MRTRSKLLLAGLTATLALAATLSSASANRLSFSTRAFTIAWASLNLSTTGGVGPIRCPVTISGNFHSSTISKVGSSLIGLINRGTAASASCTGGTLTIDQEALPWHVRYSAFRGTLPNISGFDLFMIGLKWDFMAAGIPCSSQTTPSNPLIGTININIGQIFNVTLDPRAIIPLRGGFLCGFAGNASFEGASSSATRITITLI